MARRPKWLSAICVLCMVAGALGVIGAVWGIVEPSPRGPTTRMFQGMPTSPRDPMVRRMAEADRAAAALGNRYRAVSLAVHGLHLALALLLVVGGALSLGLRPAGRAILLFGAIGSIPVDIGRAAYDHWLRTAADREFLHALGESAPAGAPNSQLVGTAVGLMALPFLIVTVVWLLSKLVLYVSTIGYLRRPSIRGLFGRPSVP